MPILGFGVQWHITEICPNRCRHCYIDDSSNVSRSERMLSFDDTKNILNNLERFEKNTNASINRFAITGGDPFCYPYFWELLREISNRGKFIRILGIPERVSETSLAHLEQFNVEGYQVSLDGMPETHDAIRGTGSFNRTIDALRLLSRSKSIEPYVMFTIHNKNCGEMFTLIEYLDALDIHISFAFDFLVFEGMARNGFSLLSKEYVEIVLHDYRKKKNELRAKNRKLVLREKSSLFNCFDIQDASQKFKQYSYVGGCGCGISGITILADGSVLPCRRLPIKVGNLLHDEYTNIFLGNELLRKLRRMSSYAGCCDCDYVKVCRGCPALTYSITGNPFDPMPYCNQKVKVNPLHIEPPLDCSENEELEYIWNTLENRCITQGVLQNREAVLYKLFKKIYIR